MATDLVNELLHSFNKYLLSVYYVVGNELEARSSMMSWDSPSPMSRYSLMGQDAIK